MKESKGEDGGIINILLLLVIIGVIFIAISYKYEKFDKFKIFHRGEIDHIATQIDSPNHVDEVHSRLIGEANITFNKLGIPDLGDLLVTDVDPLKIEEVEVQNAAGESGTVKICNNSTGRQPKYANKTLFCINGMHLVKTGPIMCCDPSQEIPEEQIGPFGRTVVGAMDLFQNHPVLGTGAVAFGMFAANYLLPMALEKGLHAAAKPVFKKISTAYGKKALEKTITSLVRSGSGSGRSIELVKNYAKGGKELIEFLENSENEQLKKLAKDLAKKQKRAGLEAAEGSAEAGAEEAAEVAAEEAASDAMVDAALDLAIEEGAVEVGEVVLEEASEEAILIGAEIALEGAAEASLGAMAASTALAAVPIVGEVVMVVMAAQMILEILDFVLNQLDVGGFGQYQDLKTIKKSMLDPTDKAFINAFKNLGINPPQIFTLESISALPNIDDHPKFKNIQENYSGGIHAYLMNLNNNLNKYISQQDKIILKAAIESGQEITENYISSLVPDIHDRPEERDRFIWNYLSNHLDSSELEYISYVPDVTSKTIIGISLNQKGVDAYNIIVDEIIEANREKNKGDTSSDANNPNKVKYTKYYKDLDENNELVQKALPQKFCLVRGLKDDMIEHLCTEGIDPEELAKKFPLREAACCGEWCKEEIIKPKDYDVTYNVDTGLCNYTQKYCKEMGYDAMENVEIKCDGDGCGASTFKNCKLSDGQDALSLGGVMPEFVVHEWARNPGAVVAGAVALPATLVVAGGAAVGAAALAADQCAAQALGIDVPI